MITIYDKTGSNSKSLSTFGTESEIKIGYPESRNKLLEVPGKSGYIDASEVLTGYPVYDNRQISFRLDITNVSASLNEATTSELVTFSHGKNIRVVFDFDSTHYYFGKCKITVDRVTPKYYRLTFSIDCDPYAYASSLTSISYSGAGNKVISSVMPTEITISATTQTVLTRNSVQTTYTVGDHVIKYPLLYGSETIVIASGTGSIKYREGKL